MGAVLLSVVAILACGGLGAVTGYALAGLLGLAGIPAALVAAVAGMIVATLAWAGGVALLRRLGWLR